jgi:hypothetical protein
MASLCGAFPLLVKLYADGYQGPQFQSAMKSILARVNVEIVKRSDQAKGFVTLPKRWIVERTLAWLGRCRRLAKDWECLNRNALAFLRLASIRLMLRKLCNPARCFRTELSVFLRRMRRGIGQDGRFIVLAVRHIPQLLDGVPTGWRLPRVAPPKHTLGDLIFSKRFVRFSSVFVAKLYAAARAYFEGRAAKTIAGRLMDLVITANRTDVHRVRPL